MCINTAVISSLSFHLFGLFSFYMVWYDHKVWKMQQTNWLFFFLFTLRRRIKIKSAKLWATHISCTNSYKFSIRCRNSRVASIKKKWPYQYELWSNLNRHPKTDDKCYSLSLSLCIWYWTCSCVNQLDWIFYATSTLLIESHHQADRTSNKIKSRRRRAKKKQNKTTNPKTVWQFQQSWLS